MRIKTGGIEVDSSDRGPVPPGNYRLYRSTGRGIRSNGVQGIERTARGMRNAPAVAPSNAETNALIPSNKPRLKPISSPAMTANATPGPQVRTYLCVSTSHPHSRGVASPRWPGCIDQRSKFRPVAVVFE
jgi:hypothetical protein